MLNTVVARPALDPVCSLIKFGQYVWGICVSYSRGKGNAISAISSEYNLNYVFKILTVRDDVFSL